MELMALCVASLNDQSPLFECVLGGGEAFLKQQQMGEKRRASDFGQQHWPQRGEW